MPALNAQYQQANRYKVHLVLQRAKITEGLLKEDRIAMLREATNLALLGVSRFPIDKYAYTAYGDVGLAMAEISGDTTVLDNAIEKMREAIDKILDPQLIGVSRSLERQRRRYSS